MKLLSLIFSAAFVCATFLLPAQNTLPSVEAKTLDGQTVNLLETYGGENGKITIISFWATWCKPCQAELDAITDLYAEWQENYDVELVAISIDDQRAIAKVGPLVETKGWDYTILLGNENTMRNSFNFSSIPQTFVVDKTGHIAFIHNGYAPGDEEELDEQIQKISEK
ncbi:MAG: TlpA family protein disulfide reductase [Saprospirales bacterium]|nr:TlpA family protein disulfide reductase [Saprospirales bacterium]MBK8490659.1 TlpA family protein disulfide reductase [Saprospirales bacterium]